jgi:hypothetical protein
VSSSSQPANESPAEAKEPGCPTGKRPHGSYGAALAALIDIDRREGRADRGSVYECEVCGLYHTSKRLFTVSRRRGLGRSRRGVIAHEGRV